MMPFEKSSQTPEVARFVQGGRPYQRPVLRDLGAVAVLTQGGTGVNCDGNGMSKDMGAPCGV